MSKRKVEKTKERVGRVTGSERATGRLFQITVPTTENARRCMVTILEKRTRNSPRAAERSERLSRETYTGVKAHIDLSRMELEPGSTTGITAKIYFSL